MPFRAALRYARPCLVQPPCISQQSSMFDSTRSVELSFSVPAPPSPHSDPAAGWVLHAVKPGQAAARIEAQRVTCRSGYCFPLSGRGSWTPSWQQQSETLITFRVDVTATEPGVIKFLLLQSKQRLPATAKSPRQDARLPTWAVQAACVADGMFGEGAITAPLLVLPSAAAVAEVDALLRDMTQQLHNADMWEADAAAVITSASSNISTDGSDELSQLMGSSSLASKLASKGSSSVADDATSQQQLMLQQAWSEHLRPLLHDLELLLTTGQNSAPSHACDTAAAAASVPWVPAPMPTPSAAATPASTAAGPAPAAAAAAATGVRASLGTPSWLVQQASAAIASACGPITTPLLPAVPPAPQPPAMSHRLQGEQQLQVALLEGLLQFFSSNGMWCCTSFLLASCLRNGLVAPSGAGACLGPSQLQHTLKLGRRCKQAVSVHSAVCSDDEDEAEFDATNEAGQVGNAATCKQQLLQAVKVGVHAIAQHKPLRRAGGQAGSIISNGHMQRQAADSCAAPDAGLVWRIALLLLLVLVAGAQLMFVLCMGS